MPPSEAGSSKSKSSKKSKPSKPLEKPSKPSEKPSKPSEKVLDINYDPAAFKLKGSDSIINASPTDQKTLLEGFITVPPDLWNKIPSGSIIRYHKIDGEFSRGGYVKEHFEKDGESIIKVGSSYNMNAPNYYTFNVNTKNVKQMYKRIAPSAYVEIELISRSIRTIENEIKQLKNKYLKN